MAGTCLFCGAEMLDTDPIFISEDQEKCHQKCLERKLVGLEFKGVQPELIEAILNSYTQQPKKQGFWPFKKRKSHDT